jgi:hypothetical protein
MKYVYRLLSLVVLVSMVSGACGIVNADETALRPAPDSVMKGSTQPVRFDWPTALATTDTGLSKAKKATVAGQTAIPVGNSTQQSITLTLPPIDIVGTADVRVMDEKDQVIATATLRYVSALDTSAKSEGEGNTGVLVLYVVLLVLFPFALMWTDILKAYRFARETRTLLMAKFSPDKVTLDELKVLVADLDTSPPGIPGLARATFAFTLLLVIGLILFHVLVNSPGHDIPPGVDKLLTLLGTALTSIIAFYFGTKAAEGSQQTASTGPAGSAANGQKSPVSTVTPTPNHGKANDEIVLSGGGFGTNPGGVDFGSTTASVVSWSEKEVKVKVPVGINGKTTITVKPQGGTPITSVSGSFSIDG